MEYKSFAYNTKILFEKDERLFSLIQKQNTTVQKGLGAYEKKYYECDNSCFSENMFEEGSSVYLTESEIEEIADFVYILENSKVYKARATFAETQTKQHTQMTLTTQTFPWKGGVILDIRITGITEFDCYVVEDIPKKELFYPAFPATHISIATKWVGDVIRDITSNFRIKIRLKKPIDASTIIKVKITCKADGFVDDKITYIKLKKSGKFKGYCPAGFKPVSFIPQPKIFDSGIKRSSIEEDSIVEIDENNCFEGDIVGFCGMDLASEPESTECNGYNLSFFSNESTVIIEEDLNVTKIQQDQWSYKDSITSSGKITYVLNKNVPYPKGFILRETK